MIGPSSPSSGIERGRTTEAKTSMSRTEYTIDYYAEVNPTRNNLVAGYYAHYNLTRSGKLSYAA